MGRKNKKQIKLVERNAEVGAKKDRIKKSYSREDRLERILRLLQLKRGHNMLEKMSYVLRKSQMSGCCMHVSLSKKFPEKSV
jgi:hypothetical protein